MMKLTIRNKLLLAFVAMLVFTIVVGILGINQTGQVRAVQENLYDDDVLGTADAATLSQDLLNAREQELAYILTTDAAGKTALEAAISTADKTIDTDVKKLSAGDIDGRQKDELNAFVKAWDNYKLGRDTILLPAGRAGKIA